MSQSPSRTTEGPTHSRLTRPILIAGLLGGLLGGVTSFAANRFIKPAKPEQVPSAKEEATEDARAVVELFIALLRPDTREKTEEFLEQVRLAYTDLPEDRYKEMKATLVNSRFRFAQRYGMPLHQFEPIRETAYSPNLIQFIYLERFEHGALLWRFVMYRGVDRWRIAFVNYYETEGGAFLP